MPLDKCLVITRMLPYPSVTGALEYSSQVILSLASVYQAVEVVCQEVDRQFDGENHEKFPDNVFFYTYALENVGLIRKVFSLEPLTTLKMGGRAAIESLSLRLGSNRPNMIVIDHIASSWSTSILRQWKRGNLITSIIYCTHNEEFSTRKSIAKGERKRPLYMLAHWIDAIRAWVTDRETIALSNLVTCISETDIKLHHQFHRLNHISLMPALYNGQVRPDYMINDSFPKRVCLIGSYLWSAKKNNLNQFLQVSYDLFDQHGVELFVIGNMGKPYLKKMRKQWPNVFFSGYVDDINDFLEGIRIGVVAEDVGGGFKLKILQYVFQRLPVFAIEHAITGTTLKNGESIMLYPDMDKLCEGIINEIENETLLNTLSANAYDRCRSFLDVEESEKTLRELILLAGGRR